MAHKKKTKIKSHQTRRGCNEQEESDAYTIFDAEEEKLAIGQGRNRYNSLTKERTKWTQSLQRTDAEEGYASR